MFASFIDGPIQDDVRDIEINTPTINIPIDSEECGIATYEERQFAKQPKIVTYNFIKIVNYVIKVAVYSIYQPGSVELSKSVNSFRKRHEVKKDKK